MERLKDPCPLPTLESERRRKMGEKAKLIHAPMSDVGGVMYDKDAVYINVPGNFTRGSDGELATRCSLTRADLSSFAGRR